MKINEIINENLDEITQFLSPTNQIRATRAANVGKQVANAITSPLRGFSAGFEKGEQLAQKHMRSGPDVISQPMFTKSATAKDEINLIINDINKKSQTGRLTPQNAKTALDRINSLTSNPKNNIDPNSVQSVIATLQQQINTKP